MTEKEKALLGLEFKKGGNELKAQRDRAEALCFRLNHTPPVLFKQLLIIRPAAENIHGLVRHAKRQVGITEYEQTHYSAIPS